MTPSAPNVELRLLAAVESSPTGLLMIDANGRIVLVNRAIERMFGYAREELIGQAVELLVPQRYRTTHPGDRISFAHAPSERAMGAGRDLRGVRKDGSEFPVEIGLNPVETAEGLFIVSAIVDITARKEAENAHHQLEAQLRQVQKLEAVGTLAGGIAHDFRNILNGIIGSAELLRSEVRTDQARADLGELLRFSERGRDLVNRILTFSRSHEPVRQSVSLQRQVQDAVQLMRAMLPSTVRIETDLDPDAPPILADPTSVHQVLLNLATNAAQAMPDGGLLSIGLEQLYVQDSVARANPDLREGPYARLTVKDTGSGIDPAVVERVFEPFFTTRPPGQGTGLGLAMVHGIIREHGGAIRLVSRLKKGTEVSCLFPAHETREETTARQLADVPRGQGERVLIVDDEAALARIGERRLASLGYRVTAAMSGTEALSIFWQDPQAFDLVVTDYTMPGRNGVQLALELRAIRNDIPIILITGNIEGFAAEVLAEAGIRRAMLKPLTEAELGMAVHEVLAECRHPPAGSTGDNEGRGVV
jgi:PAS domain S-box-containing protein